MAIEKLIEKIKGYVGDGVTVTENSELFKDLGVTSIDMVSLILDLEQELNISINIVDLIGTVTVGDLAKNLEKCVNK